MNVAAKATRNDRAILLFVLENWNEWSLVRAGDTLYLDLCFSGFA